MMMSSLSCDLFIFPPITPEDLIQFTALTWMKTFLGLAQRSMMGFTANFLVSILPCVAYDASKARIL
jgi:vacuole morphology and inheritance protein 14